MKYYIGYKQPNSTRVNLINEFEDKDILNLAKKTIIYNKKDFLEKLYNEKLIPSKDVELYYISKKSKNDQEEKIVFEVINSDKAYLFNDEEIYESMLEYLKEDNGLKYFYANQIRNSKHIGEIKQYINHIYYDTTEFTSFLYSLNKGYSKDFYEYASEFMNSKTYSEKNAIFHKIINELLYNSDANLIKLFQNDLTCAIKGPIQKEVDYMNKIYNNRFEEAPYDILISNYVNCKLINSQNGNENGKKYFDFVCLIIKYQELEKKRNELLVLKAIQEELKQVKNPISYYIPTTESDNDKEEFLEENDFIRYGEDPEENGYKKRNQM